MAQAFSHELLSGSTNGLGIVISQTATAGNTIHTAIAGTSSRDEVWVWVVNNDADGETRTVTVEAGDVVGTSGWTVPVPKGVGPVLVCAGTPLRNGEVLAIFADETNDCIAFGFVHRITVS